VTSTDQPETGEENVPDASAASLARARLALMRWSDGAATAAGRAQRRAKRLVGSKGLRVAQTRAKAAQTGASRLWTHLGQRSRPSVLDRDWRRFLKTAHSAVFDRGIESVMFAPTAPAASLRQLHIASINRLSGCDYRPTPRLVFDWAMSAIDEDMSEFSFVDYGAGRGRVLLMAARRNFRRVIGVEFAEELHNDALMNLRQFPRSGMRCRDVECLLEDAVRYTPPDGPAVFYFFNPFGPTIFGEALERIVQSWRGAQRRLYIVMVDPAQADLVEETGIFRPQPLPAKERLRAALFSPYRIAVYRSI
jgi:hypothetical protein